MYMYIPSSPSSSSVGLLRRSVRSMVLGGGGCGVHFMVICRVIFPLLPVAPRAGAWANPRATNRGNDINICTYIYYFWGGTIQPCSLYIEHIYIKYKWSRNVSLNRLVGHWVARKFKFQSHYFSNYKIQIFGIHRNCLALINKELTIIIYKKA